MSGPKRKKDEWDDLLNEINPEHEDDVLDADDEDYVSLDELRDEEFANDSGYRWEDWN